MLGHCSVFAKNWTIVVHLPHCIGNARTVARYSSGNYVTEESYCLPWLLGFLEGSGRPPQVGHIGLLVSPSRAFLAFLNATYIAPAEGKIWLESKSSGLWPWASAVDKAKK